jgi:hypothetical protein
VPTRLAIAVRGSPAGEQIKAAISEDGIEPGIEPRQLRQAGNCAECLGEGVLAGVERVVLVPHQGERMEERLAPLFVHQELEAHGVPVLHAELDGALFVHTICSSHQ